MKRIHVILQTLATGMIRITGLHDYRTVASEDGNLCDVKAIYERIAKQTASHHMIRGVVCEEYVEINKELKAALAM